MRAAAAIRRTFITHPFVVECRGVPILYRHVATPNGFVVDAELSASR
jgi:hypothetical protein